MVIAANQQKNSRFLWLLLPLLLIGAIGLSIWQDFGYSYDEHVEIMMVKWNADLLLEGEPIPQNLAYYGTLFNFTAEALYQLKALYSQNILKNPPPKVTPDDPYPLLREKVKVKHLVTFFTSLMAYIAVMGMISFFYGWSSAWVGALLLFFMPRFFAHSFYNPKDIPFAAFFSICLYALILLTRRFKRNLDRSGSRTISAQLGMLFGILIGVLSGIRFGGILLAPFFLLAFIIAYRDVKSKTLEHLFIFHVAAGVTALGLLILFYPSAWANPLGWILAAFGTYSEFPHEAIQFFAGEFMLPAELPWTYLPTWVLIATPIVSLVCFLGGVCVFLFRYKKLDELQKLTFVYLCLGVFFIPALIVLRDSTVYDGFRHIFFIVPPLATLAGLFVIWLYRWFKNTGLRVLFVGSLAFLFGNLAMDYVELHPYEAIYFNELVGGYEEASKKYTVEYWGLALTEEFKRLEHIAPEGANVLVAGPSESLRFFVARPDLKIRPIRPDVGLENQDIQAERPFYYVTWTKRGHHKFAPDCRVISEVRRKGILLSQTKFCT